MTNNQNKDTLQMMKKRMFIETDVLQTSELKRAKHTLYAIFTSNNVEFIPDIFDHVKDFAWHKIEEAWEVVKSCDEIYSDSSLVPLCGYGTYTGSVVVMDVMMQKAIDEKISGKELYFLQPFSGIEWEGIDMKLLKECFVNNSLFTLEFEDDQYLFKKVDIENFPKEIDYD